MPRRKREKAHTYRLRRDAEKFVAELQRRFPDRKWVVMPDPMQTFRHAAAYLDSKTKRFVYSAKLVGWRP